MLKKLLFPQMSPEMNLLLMEMLPKLSHQICVLLKRTGEEEEECDESAAETDTARRLLHSDLGKTSTQTSRGSPILR